MLKSAPKCLLLVVAAICVSFAFVGCGTSKSPTNVGATTEATWKEQIQAVASGKQDEIVIEASVISDDQLSELTQLSGLRVLKLQKGVISDQGLRSLATLPKLEQLVLRDSPLTDMGAELLASFPSLKIVNLPQTHIGDDGIKSLSRIPNLELLRLGSDKPISAGALASLRDAKNLRFVHLIGIALSDDALTPLGEIPALESLYIDGAEFSDAALSELLKRRPGLHLHLDQRHHDSDPKSANHAH